MDVLRAWAAIDAAHAIDASDRAVLDSTEPVRSLVVELFDTPDARDLYTACARLGALLAEGRASPSVAASTMDAAVLALGRGGRSVREDRIAPARASLFEGYVGGVRDAMRHESRATWEPPRCIVELGEGRAAVACGYPDDDPERRAAWAGRVAKALVRTKTREVLLAGESRSEVASALELVGIRVAKTLPRWPWPFG
jgi:hypothetical protein